LFFIRAIGAHVAACVLIFAPLGGCLEGKAPAKAAHDATASADVSADGVAADGNGLDGASGDGASDDARAPDPGGPRYGISSYGGAWRDTFAHVRAGADGDVWLFGTTASAGSGDWDGWIVHVDACGAVLASVALGGAGKDELHAGVAVGEGWIVVGASESYGHGKEAWVVRLGGELEVAWARAIGGNGWDVATAATVTSDEGAVVLGETYNFGPGAPLTHNALVFRLGPDGALLWEQTLGGGKDGDAGFDIARLAAGADVDATLIAGATESYGQGRDDVWLVRLAGDGQLLWARTYGGEEDDEGRALHIGADGSAWVTGFTRGFGAALSDVFVLHTAGDGALQSMSRYGGKGKERGYGLLPRPGGWTLVGVSDSHDGADDGYLAALDAAGEVIFMRRVGSDKADEIGTAAAVGAAGDVVWAGYTESYGAGGRDGFAGRIRVDGEGGCKVRDWPAPWKRHDVVPLMTAATPTVAHGAVAHTVTATQTSAALAVIGDKALVCTSPACP
jgi:hypothetical protein